MGNVGGVIFAVWRRFVPFLLAGMLVLHLAAAIIDGSRARWLMVALVAIVLALAIVRRHSSAL